MMKNCAQILMEFKRGFASRQGNWEKIPGKRLAGRETAGKSSILATSIQHFLNSQLKREMPALLLPVLFSHQVLQDPSLISLLI